MGIRAKSLKRAMVQQKTFTPSIGFPSPILKGLGNMPPLHGYVLTTPKERLSELILQAHVTDDDQLEQFFRELSGPIDHLMLTGRGPYYATLAEMDFEEARGDVEAHFWTVLRVARLAAAAIRPGGTMLFIGGTGGRRPSVGFSTISTFTAGMPALTKTLALELAPVRVNLIAPGFVDTPLSAALLGDGLEARREQLRATLPIRRVVGPVDIAALALHVMTNTAITGATLDIDGGQQLVDA